MESCPICLCPMVGSDVRLACGHRIHEACVAELRQHGLNNMCPLCRTPLSELRTVKTLHEELIILTVRRHRAYDWRIFDVTVDVKSLNRQMLSLAQEAYELDPDSFRTQYWLGECLKENHLYSEAKRVYQRMLSLFGYPGNPELSTIHRDFAQTLFRLEEHAEAFRHFRTAIQVEPAWAKPRMNFGYSVVECLMSPELGFPVDDDLLAEAKHHLHEAIRLDPADDHAPLFLRALNNRRLLIQLSAKEVRDSVKRDTQNPQTMMVPDPLQVVSSLPIGAKVQICNLQSPEGQMLNGKVGKINRMIDEDGRIRVEIDGEFKRLRFSNLVAVIPITEAVMRLLPDGGASSSSTQYPEVEARPHVSPISVGTGQMMGEPSGGHSPSTEHDVDPVKDPDKMLQVALAESFDAAFEASVTQLQHTEPAAVLHPTEAAQVSQQLSASWEFRIEASEGSSQRSDHGCTAGLLILAFSRHPAKLIEALLNSPPARAAIAAGVNIQPEWAKGGRVFAANVHPGLFDDELCAYHVVIHERDEQALWAALAHLPYRIKKLKPGMGRTEVPDYLSQFHVSSAESDEHGTIEVTVKNTFIHVGRRSADDTQSAHTV